MPSAERVNSNELIAALINSKESYVDGIRYAQDKIDGTASILLLTDRGTIIAARDKVGRLPVLVGKCNKLHKYQGAKRLKAAAGRCR